MRRAALVLAFLAASLGLSAFEVDDLSLHVTLSGLDRARAPFARGSWLVLSAEGAHRYVGAAFEHEGFARVHAFEKNAFGIFVLAYPIPLERAEPLAYRLVVDGAWVADPANPRRASAARTGLGLSVAEVPYLSAERPGLYSLVAEDGRTARFLWKGPPGERVTVAGDFNGWDPFLHELRETRPGVYELELALLPGTHYYCFVNRGEYRPDPLNYAKASSPEGRVVSVLVMGGAKN